MSTYTLCLLHGQVFVMEIALCGHYYMYLPLNVLTASKRVEILFAITAAGVEPSGSPKMYPSVSS